ncbi:hypothetical protein [Desulfovibrio aminophilus]|uniref:hypothetical protein n=1 Tax=Desulfovibrio aminophilus TaxID=81425 RepID=UPI003394E7B1
MTTDDRPTREEVLDAFSVEAHPDSATLEHYLNTYPEYAESLIDLSRELNRVVCQDEIPLSMRDSALIDASWNSYISTESKPISDPFSIMSIEDERAVAKKLGVPRQVILAFRERQVHISSVPPRFIDHMARAMNTSSEILMARCAGLPSNHDVTRAYKAEVKPSATEQVSFERLLIDAGVPEDKRVELLSDGD